MLLDCFYLGSGCLDRDVRVLRVLLLAGVRIRQLRGQVGGGGWGCEATL